MIRLPKLRGTGLHPAQSYTPEEISAAAGVAATTVHAWIRDNKLPAMTKGKPYLVLGCDATAFFKSLRKPTRKLSHGEMHCMHCKTARKPLGGMVDLIQLPGATLARLEGLCMVCEGTMSMGISPDDSPKMRTVFEVHMRGTAGN
jgi:hypothetical protein